MSGDAVIVFDLDDTLYLEREFAESGFRAVGCWLRDRMGIEDFAERCQDIFASGQRARIFNRALGDIGLGDRYDIVDQLVDLYRHHRPAISLAPDAARYLTKSPRGSRRAIITDGPAAMQMAKIKALGLETLIDYIICTDAWGKKFWKPHLRAFEAVEAWSQAAPAHLVYVGDNATKDFVTPRARGWWTVRIERCERIHVVGAPNPSYEPHETIETFDQLDDCLAKLDPIWLSA
jgi:putative hydrolase of the HAD superfamily